MISSQLPRTILILRTVIEVRDHGQKLCVALFVMQQISPTSVSPPNLMLLPKKLDTWFVKWDSEWTK